MGSEADAMKYLAILKDSLREAIDTKVFYAMLVLSLILIVVVGSIGFRPSEAEEALEAIVSDRQFHMVTPDRGRSNTVLAKQHLPAQFSVSNVRALSEAAAPNARDYAFTLTVNEYSPFALDRVVDFWSKPTPDGFRPGA